MLQLDIDELAFLLDYVPHGGTTHHRMDSLEVSRAFEGAERAIAAALGGSRSQLSGLGWHFGGERRNWDCSDYDPCAASASLSQPRRDRTGDTPRRCGA